MMKSRTLVFCVGFLFVSLAGYAGELAFGDTLRWIPVRDHALFAAAMCAIPTICAWTAARSVGSVFPRRMLLATAEPGIGPAILGGIACTVAIAATALLLIVTERHVHGLVVYGVCAFISTGALVAVFGGRIRPGRCVRCDYDLSASWESRRCPECGLTFRPVADSV